MERRSKSDKSQPKQFRVVESLLRATAGSSVHRRWRALGEPDVVGGCANSIEHSLDAEDGPAVLIIAPDLTTPKNASGGIVCSQADQSCCILERGPRPSPSDVRADEAPGPTIQRRNHAGAGAYTGMLSGRSAANTDPAKAEANANPTVSFFISARSAEVGFNLLAKV